MDGASHYALLHLSVVIIVACCAQGCEAKFIIQFEARDLSSEWIGRDNVTCIWIDHGWFYLVLICALGMFVVKTVMQVTLVLLPQLK